MVEPNSVDHLTVAKKKESPLTLLFSGIVIGLIALALWISINSIFEKIRISQGLDQVVTIVGMARDMAKADPQFIVNDHKDLLAVLEHAGRIQTDGSEDGVKIIRNPWKNVLIAMINADGTIRVETIVPPHVCQRFLGSFGQSPQSFGIKQVEVKGYSNAWRQIYNGATAGSISESTIAAGCGDTVQADAALTFSLR